jgi:alpha-D-xyloside xylohydrolase
MWLTAEGKRVEYAEDVYTVTESADGKALSLLCPTRKVRSRGDILNVATLTMVSTLFLFNLRFELINIGY